MKKIILTLCVFGVLLISGIVVSNPIDKSNMNDTLNQGSFEAELGLKNETEASLSLDGLFRDFRGRHILFGTISHVESDRTNSFQGFVSRNIFIIQFAVRSHIVNIVGRFTTYDEEQQEYHGVWRGFAVGVGRTSGWITASFTS